MNAADPVLVARVTDFASDLHQLLSGVLRPVADPFEVTVASDKAQVVVKQQPDAGVPLCVDGTVILRLNLKFRCAWDSAAQHLPVKSSTIGINAETTDEPLFRYDYLADCDGHIPAAHLNVHGHRDELVFAMMAAGAQHRGRTRQNQVRNGRVPRLAVLHFPLGGHRFRPSVEDILEMLVREFGIDTAGDWESAVRNGRAAWREKQLRSAVRDDPRAAVELLRSIGYEITPPADERRTRLERIHAL